MVCSREENTRKFEAVRTRITRGVSNWSLWMYSNGVKSNVYFPRSRI